MTAPTLKAVADALRVAGLHAEVDTGLDVLDATCPVCRHEDGLQVRVMNGELRPRCESGCARAALLPVLQFLLNRASNASTPIRHELHKACSPSAAPSSPHEASFLPVPTMPYGGREDREETEGDVGDSDRRRRAIRRAAHLGLANDPGGLSACLLPGHADHYMQKVVRHGHVSGRCTKYDGATFSLPELRAITAYADVPKQVPKRETPPTGAMARVRVPSPQELARWGERLDYEVGLRVPDETPALVLPDDLTRAGQIVGEGVVLFLGLRSEEAPPRFPFARDFARAWCSVSDSIARYGVDELEERGLLVKVAVWRRTKLFLPHTAIEAML